MKTAINTKWIAFFTILAVFTSSALAIGPKEIESTPFCSNMQLIDNAESWGDDTPTDFKADRIVVSKTRKKLYLLNEGRIISEYPVSFGFGFKEGAKERRGDGRTPEGLYKIALKKPETSYHLALEVSYPNKSDIEYARKLGVDPGGDILIHGFPERVIDNLVPEVIKNVHPFRDWTQGCMAVTNEQIEEIYNLVDAEVALEICSFEN